MTTLSKNISKREHQHRDLSTSLRFGRDDKGEGGAPIESSYRTGLFIPLGGIQAHHLSDRDDKFVAKITAGIHHKFVIPTEAYPDFLPRGIGQGSVCALPQRRAHQVYQRQQCPTGNPG
jgi:hypothetical protein